MVWSTEKCLAGRKIASQGKLLVLELMLVAVVVVFIPSANGAPTTADLKSRGCKSMCGNFMIQYPFGDKEDCYFNDAFLINCSDSKPYLRHGNIEVLSVSVARGEGELHILMYTARGCHNSSDNSFGDNPNDGTSASLELTKFSISNKNKFTVIGCDTYAHIQSEETNDATGCTSQCSSLDDVESGTCSGFGCCQLSIPKGLSNISMEVSSFNNHTNISQFNPCSYAFLVEPGNFTFSKTRLRDFNQEEMPMIVDWVIENKTCQEAQKNPSSYACGENTHCIDAKNARGYLCNCSSGYRGNPYLSDGCEDINECDEDNDCIHKDKCKNTPGNYTCSCPKGHHGDGRKNGERCSADQLLMIQIVIGVCAGVGGFLLLGAAWQLDKVIKKISDKKRKEKFFKRNGGFLLQQQLSSSEGNVDKTKVFNSKELEKATDYYNEDRILGQGGQGTVYKGMLSDGRIVAIKKSKMVDEGNVKQFINEVAILSQINHRNVVKLFGCCLETEVPLLVYEFIPNGTLFQHIHDSNEEFPLLWEERLRIATETAEALYYLHYAASIPIYHRDIKSTNILLDDKYKAKVSDFGASRSVTIEQTHLTTLVKGTFGYLDPEYFQSSQFTDKSDVYSFGVVLVELLTGEKPIMSTTRSHERRSLASYFIQSMEENHLLEILDPQILKEGLREEMEVVARVAKRCLNLNGKKRPTMKEVAVELEGIRTLGQGSITLHHDQQNYEVEYNAIDVSVSMDVASTSTSTFNASGTSSSFDVETVLINHQV